MKAAMVSVQGLITLVLIFRTHKAKLLLEAAQKLAGEGRYYPNVEGGGT